MHDCWYSDGEYGNSFFALGADGSRPFLGNLSYVNLVDQANGRLLAVAFSVPDPDAGAENHKSSGSGWPIPSGLARGRAAGRYHRDHEHPTAPPGGGRHAQPGRRAGQAVAGRPGGQVDAAVG